MNPRLELLQPYPFERLRALLAQPAAAAGAPAAADRPAQRFINLSIGEPRHPTPPPIKTALSGALAGLAGYPATAGTPALREAIAAWIGRRHQVSLDPATEILPVNGSREALFAFAQTVIDPVPGALVVAPNPFYQIYEGAALLAGAQVHLVDQSPATGLRCDWASVPAETWARTQLVFVCSPGNPTGAVMPQAEWQQLFELADRHGFVVLAPDTITAGERVYPGAQAYWTAPFYEKNPKATQYCAMAKRFATDAGFEVANQALQLHGGYGYLKDYPLERIVRDLRVHRILEGTNEIMRVITAREMMRQ